MNAKTSESTNPHTAAGKGEELAQAAFTLFSTRGIDRVNLDEVAAAAGVTKGSLYWHYSSKKAVVLAACDLYYLRWRAQISAATDSCAGAYATLEAAVAYSVRSCLLDDANRVFSTEIVALSLYDTDVRASWAGFLDETQRYFLGLTHQAVGSGELVCADVDRAVDLMVAAMEGIKQIALFQPQICGPQSEQRTCIRLMSLLGSQQER
ncbi:TetR/AcrR family transcriptional regulator [Nakamurella silvestris]|nr:TetR/AcrR family transcriptional regulator [Nakamurella silvestris]